MTQVAPVWFEHERIHDGLYRISEPHYTWFNRANIWLVRGRDADMLVDTGLGVSDLRSYLADLLDKPLKVVASHVHFDHAGSCHEFDDVLIHRNEHEALCQGDQDAILASPKFGWVPQEDFYKLPYEGFTASEYAVKACPQAKAIRHGDVIDLGDRAFEVWHLPGHSSGSVGLYDKKHGQFFSGDVVYDGELLDKLPDSVVADYIASMEQLLELSADSIHPGHYRSFDRATLRVLVKKYIETQKAPLCPAESAPV
jgi:glyoxylase-like metal-dependent hydrolase (beta-lactamase superfamily II)